MNDPDPSLSSSHGSNFAPVSPTDTTSEAPALSESLGRVSVAGYREMLRAAERYEAAWRAGAPVNEDSVLQAVPAERQAEVRRVLRSLRGELERARWAHGTGGPAGMNERFQVVRLISRGGMGQVSVAVDRELGRLVAFKEILPGGVDNPDYRQRFQTEAEITADLEHPGIIPVYSRGELPDGRPYYTMRLITGDQSGTLEQAVRELHHEWTKATGGGQADQQSWYSPADPPVARAGRASTRSVPPASGGEALIQKRFGLDSIGPPPMNSCLGEAGRAASDSVALNPLAPATADLGLSDQEPSPGGDGTVARLGVVTVAEPAHRRRVVPGHAGGEWDRALRSLLRRVIEVCQTMEYAHSRGVLHRDLKPSNILLGPYGETLVVDWGLAQRQKSSLAGIAVAGSHGGQSPGNQTHGVGTVGYAAPEQLLGEAEPGNATGDVYSLGGVLYCVLTGQAPFRVLPGESPSQVLRRVREGGFPAVRQLNPRIDPPLAAICERALATDPHARYPSVARLAADLERWLADEPVEAWREPVERRARRWMARHQVALGGVAGGLVLVSLGLATLAVVEGRHRRTLAEEAIKLEQALTSSQRARAQTEAERERAVAGELQAVEAVARFHRAVANNRELRQSAQLSTLRRDLLREPVEFHRSLRERLLAVEEPSASNLVALRKATRELVELHVEVGETGPALSLVDELVALCDRELGPGRRGEAGEQADWRLARAEANLLAGTALLRTGDVEERLERFEEASAEYEELARNSPSLPGACEGLVNAWAGAGQALADLGRGDEARRAYAESVSSLEAGLRAEPDNPALRRSGAQMRINYSLLLSRAGEAAAARAEVAAAERLYPELARGGTGDPQFPHREATALLNEALGLERQQRLVAALPVYERAANEWRRLAREFPAQNELWQGLRQTLWGWGQLLQRVRGPGEALPVWLELVPLERATVERNPAGLEERGRLLEAWHHQGHAMILVGRSREAEGVFDSALPLAESLVAQQPQEVKWYRQMLDLWLHRVTFREEAGEWERARDWLQERLPLARLFARRADLTREDRGLLRTYLTMLADVQERLEDSREENTAQELRTWDDQDPDLQVVNARLREVAAGLATVNATEALALAQRAWARREYEVAWRLYAQGLERIPVKSVEPGALVGSRAATAALRSGREARLGAERAAVRRAKALEWLQADWEATQERGQRDGGLAGLNLRSWFRSPAIDRLRRPGAMEDWPREEREAWQELLQKVASHLAGKSPPSGL